MSDPVRYTPLINGTAFMGMGENTGLNEGKEYPYILYTDHEAEVKRLNEYWEECLRKVDRKLDAVQLECDKWRHDAQILAIREMGLKRD